MNRPKAKTIRARQLQGLRVQQADADLAAFRLSRVGNRKFVLPKLSSEAKEQANAMLLCRLGEALG